VLQSQRGGDARRGARAQAGPRRRGGLQPDGRSSDRRFRRCQTDPEIRRSARGFSARCEARLLTDDPCSGGESGEGRWPPMKTAIGGQAFRSNWLRSLSAMASIMSQRSASRCGPSLMISTFQESSCGTTEMARSVGQSLMSSISSLMADSSSSRVFAGFFKLILSPCGMGPPPFGYPRERVFLNSEREPLALRYRRRTQTAGDGPTSQRRCRHNVPPAG
jgi:hypothetical protein